MKISDLLRYKLSIDFDSLNSWQDYNQQSFLSAKESIYHNDEKCNSLKDELDLLNQQMIERILKSNNVLHQYRDHLNNLIASLEPSYYDLSEQIYKDSLHDTPEYILQRSNENLLFNDQHAYDLFLARIGVYNNWKYPAIQIRPGSGVFTELIKGCDPLYLVDTDVKLFDVVKTKWNQQYQNRLRYYTIDDQTDSEIFKDFPPNQYGLILAIDYFNYKPLRIIKKMISEFYKKLRPGGVAVFTFNNCDLPFSVRNVENKFCCYTPGKQVQNILHEAGFEIIYQADQHTSVSWYEARKPGKIASLRGGQALAEIRKFN